MRRLGGIGFDCGSLFDRRFCLNVELVGMSGRCLSYWVQCNSGGEPERGVVEICHMIVGRCVMAEFEIRLEDGRTVVSDRHGRWSQRFELLTLEQ